MSKDEDFGLQCRPRPEQTDHRPPDQLEERGGPSACFGFAVGTAGQPGLPTRLVAGLFILKHIHNLSDEVLCARWLENPYYQFFCGDLSHKLPFDRSSLTHWRQRLGDPPHPRRQRLSRP
jgi:hypothetical protein